ncbi:site-specific DNA-methyltransferase [Cellulomonas wangsupingiae]|uniref:Site-specific DNA-methyltransferase n=1 Tax=Cellulomonas wangsupingiae TaxID=2968085 RepID=A0ABY5K8Z4_9CELL|nr:site-specific DNA-methyltransferase [Cellulomonas wangsupingiae]MCC2333615.1 site-specific DNA-methyltransferase [Cellulomonas wangsupingiae]UUI64883.1 site-specific DNA-methyltransferase [Cellulomonas wangsupingiae]
MEKLRMHSPDLTQANIDSIAALFPTVVTETRTCTDISGAHTHSRDCYVKAVDFDLLRQELSDRVVDGPQERYQLDWPGKREALFVANAPIAKTLRPAREESVDFDTTKNVFIEGDNLDVLKLLQESYLGKVKLIYIDPPYNTGNDFIYDDDFAESTNEYLERSGQVAAGGRLVANPEANGRFHSDWLSMMYPRLKLARDLLAENGAIFMSIDDNEVDSLKALASEVFGATNFVAQIIWQKVYAPKNSAQWFSEDHDYIVVFARNKAAFSLNRLPRTAEMEARYKNPDNDPRGPWKAADMSARNRYDAGVYAVTTPSGRLIPGPPTGRYWVIDEARFRALDADRRIWWGTDGSNAPAVKKFLSEVAAGRTPQTLWPYDEVGHTQDAKKTLLKYVPFQHTENVLNSVKPVQLLQRVLQLATRPDTHDIVLDFFGGSATTAHAVLEQNRTDGGNRSFISVTFNEPLPKPEPTFGTIFEMGTERIRNVAAEITAELATSGAVDTGFRVLRVDSTNIADTLHTADGTDQLTLDLTADSIKADRSGEDLLFEVLLTWGLAMDLPIEPIMLGSARAFDVDSGTLVACFASAVEDSVVRAAAERKPLRVVFLDSSFSDDASRINAEQIFREVSPDTEFKVI